MLVSGLGIVDDGKTMLQAQPVADFSHGAARAEKVAELAGGVCVCGIVDDMGMNMLWVDMGGHDQLMSALAFSSPESTLKAPRARASISNSPA